ncbi:MAG: hypothetical protein ACSLE1_02770 [Sphingobium sp.]
MTLSLDIVQCAPDLMIETSLKADAVAGARDAVLHVSGADLAASATKRSLTITVDENGVISGMNATVTDQQAVILGNIIKIAATAASFASGPEDTAEIQCSQKAKENVATITAAKAQITTLRSGLATSPDPEGDQKKINAFAALLAAAKGALHADLTGIVKIDATMSGAAQAKTVEFDWKPAAELLETAYVGPGNKPTVAGVDDKGAAAFQVTAFYTALADPSSALGGESRTSSEPCKQWVTVPASQYVKLTLLRPGTIVKGTIETPPIEQTIPVSQLASDAQLCLSAAFGENRTVGLKFDKFGRTAEFSWSADARAANVTSALAGMAPDAAGIVSTLHGRDLAADKRELDELTTSQSLRKARACQAQLDAGADKCL